MHTLKELQPLIIQWAKDKNFVKEEFAPKQRLKLIEESGELASAILKNKVDEQKDAIGDMFVVIVILFEQCNRHIEFDYILIDDESTALFSEIMELFKLTDFDIPNNFIGDILLKLHLIANRLDLELTQCANIAWNEIKDRTGNTVNGTFIKH